MIIKLRQYYIRVPKEIEQLIINLDDEPRENNGAVGLIKIKNQTGKNSIGILEKLFKVIEYNAGPTASDNILFQSAKDLLVQIYRVSHLHQINTWEIDEIN